MGIFRITAATAGRHQGHDQTDKLPQDEGNVYWKAGGMEVKMIHELSRHFFLFIVCMKTNRVSETRWNHRSTTKLCMIIPRSKNQMCLRIVTCCMETLPLTINRFKFSASTEKKQKPDSINGVEEGSSNDLVSHKDEGLWTEMTEWCTVSPVCYYQLLQTSAAKKKNK